MKISFLFIQISSIYAIFYSGICPHSTIKQVDWNCSQIEYKYVILAAVSTSNLSVNIFHNYFSKIDCVRLWMSCGKYFRFKSVILLGCNAALYGEAFKYCYPLLVESHGSLKNFRMKFDFLPDVDCAEEKIWDQYSILAYEFQVYYILWACRQLNRTTNEQGAYLLLNDNFAQDNTAKYVNIFKETISLNKIPIQAHQIIFNEFNLTGCVCRDCDYLMKCQTGSQMENSVEYNVPESNLSLYIIYSIIGLLACVTIRLCCRFMTKIKERNTRVEPDLNAMS